MKSSCQGYGLSIVLEWMDGSGLEIFNLKHPEYYNLQL